MISARAKANLIATAIVIGAVTLYHYPPQQYSFYPRCPFFSLTHQYCPGCGTTRALSELLHGHFSAALHFNALATLLVPFAVVYLAMMYCAALRENRLEWPRLPDWSWKLALGCSAFFGIARMFAQGTL